MLDDAGVTSARTAGSNLLTKCTASCVSSQLQQSEGPFSFTMASCSSANQDVQSFPSVFMADEETISGVSLSSSQHTADDSSLMVASLDTSTLGRKLSDLQFDSTLEPKDTHRQAKSASDSILLRKSSTYASKPACSPPKPKVQKLRRRKQEFNQLLRTPPDGRQNANGRTGIEHRKSEADSGFGSFSESGNSAVDSELKTLMEDAVLRPRTPPLQIRVRSPVGEAADIDASSGDADDGADWEDLSLMLFTPFKISTGGNELPELSPDIELSASIVAGSDSWASFTPVSSGARARTSTPCRLLGTIPENRSKCASSHNDSGASPRLSHLLSEFDDAGLCSFDGVTVYENMPLGELTSSGVLTLDEAVELDVTDLSFRELH